MPQGGDIRKTGEVECGVPCIYENVNRAKLAKRKVTELQNGLLCDLSGR